MVSNYEGKCAKNNGCCYNLIRGQCETWEQSQIRLSQCYQNALLWECNVYEEDCLYEHSKESIQR